VTILSCSKIFPDEELTLSKENIGEGILKLDGYYYYEHSNSQGPLFRKFALYRNGVIKYIGSSSEINEGIFYGSGEKGDWGLYKIYGTKILYEKWNADNTKYNVYTYEGQILNDSTYRMTSSYQLDKGNKTNVRSFDEVYHFYKFSPKPDSTNEFIK